jgi:diaminopropionate ammonia-lyase
MRLVVNPVASRGAYTQQEAKIASRSAAEAARREISSWPGYAPTPVRPLPELAQEIGVREVWLKDESDRLGQGSFKALGGAYATALKLRELNVAGAVTLCCATEGNHGRSVAFAAKRLGCKAVVYVGERALDYKVAAIEALGARVVRTSGTFDDAARLAQGTARAEGWILISDTNDPMDETVHRVMQGYGVIALELLEQFSGRDFPTHIFIQGGAGGLAAGIAGVLSDVLRERRPTLLVVEPETAACLLESATRLAPARIRGELRTRMQMLAVGEASPAAWPLLQRRIDAFMAIADRPAVQAAARLNAPEGRRPPLGIGVTGAASLGGLLELARNSEFAAVLRLDAAARVLVFGTEAGPPPGTDHDGTDLRA